MSKTVKLTSKEFLSMFTGFNFCENFYEVRNGFEKYYDVEPNTISDATLLMYADKFYKEIIDNQKDLYKAVMNSGMFYLISKKTILKEQIECIVENFEKKIGKNFVELPVANHKNIKKEDEISM